MCIKYMLFYTTFLKKEHFQIFREMVKKTLKMRKCLLFLVSGGGPVHVRIPIHAHPLISPKQSQLHNKLPMCMINLIIIYVVVNSFSMKNHKSLRKLRVGVNR